jgi:DnaK suppressor protein
MGDKRPRFDASYLDRKRRQLTELRDELRGTSNAAEAAESDIKLDSSSGPREYEDDAQRLDMLETEGNLVRRDVGRLARIERALEKIVEGTYGLSDVSGEAIPTDRLESMPDALNTVAEQNASERAG